MLSGTTVMVEERLSVQDDLENIQLGYKSVIVMTAQSYVTI